MLIVLAGYFQPENHGPGRKIGISTGKPRNLYEKGYECDLVMDSLAPNGDDYWAYQDAKKQAKKVEATDNEEAARIMRDAADAFVSSYKNKLDSLKETVLEMATNENKTPQEVLPLQDGDTLLSWENAGHTSYRTILAEYLRELGYDVEEN